MYNDVVIVNFFWIWEDVLFPSQWTYVKLPDIIKNWYKVFDRNKVLNLPPKKEWHYYIVKDIIALICLDRDDLLVVAEPVHDRGRWYYRKLLPVKLIK